MGKTVRGPIGPPGNPGPPGPPGLPGDSGGSEGRGELCRQPPNLVMDGGLIQPLACPMSAPSRQLLERSYFEAGSLIYLQDENKLVLKTSSKWVELQVRLIFHFGTLSHDIGFKIPLVKFGVSAQLPKKTVDRCVSISRTFYSILGSIHI